MRARLCLALTAAVLVLLGLTGAASASGDTNPYDYGIYSQEDRAGRVYRYDPRSWYYSQRGHYPYYASRYWVPRAEMRYRNRYRYYGPPYRYYPAWGYPHPHHKDDCCHWGW
jgi:hypothetical protein